MKQHKFLYLLTCVFLLSTGNWAAAQDEFPEVTIEGLQRVKDSNLTLVYAEPGIDWGQYQRIYLADTYVAFRKNWQRSQGRSGTQSIRADDMERIKTELASLFRQVFTEILGEGGYELVTERAEDVLIIKPAIINLDIAAPDVGSTGISYTYTESAGEMTLYLELYDSLTDDLIAKAADRQLSRETGYFHWRNRATNRAAARRILKVWANVLKEGLDEARSVQ